MRLGIYYPYDTSLKSLPQLSSCRPRGVGDLLLVEVKKLAIPHEDPAVDHGHGDRSVGEAEEEVTQEGI